MTEGTNSPFSRGQRVVCVDVDGGNVPELKKGAIYVVRAYVSNFCPHIKYPGMQRVVWLQEIIRRYVECCDGSFELPFAAIRFRPVIERQTDISVFTALLQPHQKREVTS